MKDSLFIKIRNFTRFQQFILYRLLGYKAMCDVQIELMNNFEREKVYKFLTKINARNIS